MYMSSHIPVLSETRDHGGKALSRSDERKRNRQDPPKEDRISELLDDILICIISRLTFREATRTSILSTRWQQLHTKITCSSFHPLKPPKRTIVFEPPRRMKNNNVCRGLKTLEELQVYNISRVLNSYKGIDVLKDFKLTISCSEIVDVVRWLEFASSREIRIISLFIDYRVIDSTKRNSDQQRDLREVNILDFMQNNGILPFFPIRTWICMYGRCYITSLETLSFYNVDVEGEDIDILVSCCQVLENLSITGSERLEDLVVVGWPEMKLKNLEISYCHFKSIRIKNLTNLVSFTYRGWKTNLVVENVPKLIKVDISGGFGNNLPVELLSSTLSCCTHQLVKLSMGVFYLSTILKHGVHIETLPKLANLKHLELGVRMEIASCVLTLTPLIEASPFLEKLDVKFLWCTPEFMNKETSNQDLRKHPHYSLKRVKFSGYLGSPYELEFALYIFKNAVKLKEFVVDPCDRIWIPSRKIDKKIVRRNASAIALEQFQAVTPKSVKLVIL